MRDLDLKQLVLPDMVSLIALYSHGCTSSTDWSKAGEIPQITVNIDHSTAIAADRFFEQIEYISLGVVEHGDPTISNIVNLEVTDSAIYVLEADGPFSHPYVRIYDRQGAYLRSIDGLIEPNYFASATFLSVFNGQLDVIDYATGSLLSFDTDGTYLKTLSLPDRYLEVRRLETNLVAFDADSRSTISGKNVCLVNEATNEITHHIPAISDPKSIEGNRHKAFYPGGDENWLYTRPFDYTIYEVLETKLEPLFEVSLGDHWLNLKDYRNRADMLNALMKRVR